MKILVIIMVIVALGVCLWGWLWQRLNMILSEERAKPKDERREKQAWCRFFKEQKMIIIAAIILWGVSIFIASAFMPVCEGKIMNALAQITRWCGILTPLVGVGLLAITER